MANTRKIRRAQRELEQQVAIAREAKRQGRRRSRKALWRKVTLHEIRQRSSGRIGRRSRGERIFIGVLAVVSVAAIWYFSTSAALAIALTAAMLLFLPVLIVLLFDRRSA